ncbi:MAG: ABC transporter ATP-binding protein [Clostridia bacterium]|nr:ABC transporter ATP-binding protein [Clostridia bacterium]MBQ3867761.1 ABC transporter ATP-binding protein [Clostridia bacterium]MBR0158093.1 ABC transporter ATP-binding protein [Clostridia bacterium]MBR7061533.1 ABC transporter ATP-binding protein [Clostridia bacterium]
METGEFILRAENVTRDFYRKSEVIHAVRGVNVNIKRGTFNILCGRSGSGKTTLINMLAAIDTPTSGQIFFEDVNVSLLNERKRDELRRRNIGIIFQNTALLAQMSAVENVEFSLSVSGKKIKNKRDLAIEWLDKLGIRERRNHMPAEMSGGEQARVAISRALVHSPKLVLADEPTAELDSRTSFRVVDLFRELVDKQGLTIVMTTHDVNIMDVADTIYTMEDGVIVSERKGNRSL